MVGKIQCEILRFSCPIQREQNKVPCDDSIGKCFLCKDHPLYRGKDE
jgi:hypothetical protein